ncbi:hypothetical protein VMCG_02065 [Cytospora schulzeri]|uniref:FAD-binding domain-containing protein n=1 Tax=Cytospora schulzeri TaxID=448051 RepID=A0A423X3P0_9PEZI|nr:hypothetical protein VMCG_02065 [Valsa malicola]
MYHIPGRRMVATRTGNQPFTQVTLSTMSPSQKLIESMSRSADEQKAAWAEDFKGAGWKTSQLSNGMLDSADFFYVSESAQVRMDQWHKGRLVLLGDARYCPSPNSGLGSTASLVGCYVMAGHLDEHGDDVDAALGAYETEMRPFVTEGAEVGTQNSEVVLLRHAE